MFLPLVGTSEDDDEQEGGVYQSDTEQQDEDGFILNREEYDNTDGDDVEYTDWEKGGWGNKESMQFM